MPRNFNLIALTLFKCLVTVPPFHCIRTIIIYYFTELYPRFCRWTLIWLSCHWAWLRRGYWRYRSLIDWFIDYNLGHTGRQCNEYNSCSWKKNNLNQNQVMQFVFFRVLWSDHFLLYGNSNSLFHPPPPQSISKCMQTFELLSFTLNWI